MTVQLISSLFIFAVGLGIGILVQRYVLSRGTHVALLEQELNKVKGEQLSLKDSLQQHYHQTSELTQNLTNNYIALYDHLAQGSDQFTEQPLADLKHLLEQAAGPRKVQAPKDYAEAIETESNQPS